MLKYISCTLLAGVVFFSCQKKFLCPDCDTNSNKPPIANAGADQTITLPKDSVLLDGSASADPDGTITAFKWAKIAGPASANITMPGSSKTITKSLAAGVYQFELAVTDNGGLSAKDTVQVMVDAPGNQPPGACAGADQTITLPANTVTLDGSCSADSDNNITSYEWTKISGPSTFSISNTNVVQIQVTGLIQGVYQFELKVTDAGGLFSKDTVQITVNTTAVSSNDCDLSNRPFINARLMQIGTLSEKREGIAVASAGDKILFAGGHQPVAPFARTSRVDIFDVTANSWSTAQLSVARSYIATAVLGNKILFAGGYTGGNPSSRVDIYDAVTGIWTTAELSVGRGGMAAAAAGHKVLFAGGGSGPFQYSHLVDIYDASTGTWSASSLSGRTPTGTVGMSATAVGNKIYIAGEASDADNWDAGSISSIINIYDVTTNTWSVSDLSIPRGYMASIANGSKIFWAGGIFKQPFDLLTSLVEIRDINSGLSTFSCLSLPNGDFSAAQKNNQIVFFTSHFDWHPAYFTVTPPAYNRFDILNINTNTWSIGVLPVNIHGASIISVNNTIYVAGGLVNGIVSNTVWKLEF